MVHSGTLFDRVSQLAQQAGMAPLPEPETGEDYKAVPPVLTAHLLYQVFRQLVALTDLVEHLSEHCTGEQFVNLNDEPNGEV